MKNLPYFYGSHDKFEELAGPMLEIPTIRLGVTMRLIIQDRNNVIFNGINISDEVKSQVTGINFITKEVKLTRDATFFEALRVKLFGKYSSTSSNDEIFKPCVLKKGKKYSIYIEGVEKQEFCKGLLTVTCEEVFINEIGKIYVETATSAETIEKNNNIDW